MSNLIKFFRLSWEKKFLLLEACALLATFRLVLAVLAFKKIEPHLGQHMYETPDENTARDGMTAKTVGWAVNTMSRHTLWESKCLVQAMTAKYMLRRRGVKSTLYLGVARDENQEMIAHAWLRSGGRIVTGARTKEKFVAVSSFGDR